MIMTFDNYVRELDDIYLLYINWTGFLAAHLLNYYFVVTFVRLLATVMMAMIQLSIP